MREKEEVKERGFLLFSDFGNENVKGQEKGQLEPKPEVKSTAPAPKP